MLEIQAKRQAPKTPDDILDICRLAGEGNPDARRRLMDLLFNRIHKTASYLSGNLEDAKDIAQTACVEVLHSVGSYRGDAALTFWADRVTLQTASKVFTKKTRRQRLKEKYLQAPRPPMSIDEVTGRTQVRDRLTELLTSMKIKQREVVVLRYIHGYSNQEVADLCKIPLETARDRLKRGRAALKKKVLADPLLKDWIREWGDI